MTTKYHCGMMLKYKDDHYTGTTIINKIRNLKKDDIILITHISDDKIYSGIWEFSINDVDKSFDIVDAKKTKVKE